MLPSAGEIFWVEFDPALGSEQAGRRPALVVSEKSYHEVSTRSLVCPVTSRARDWPFNVVIPDGGLVSGMILVDQARMIHRPTRMFGALGEVPRETLAEVRGILASLAGIRL